ncbi:hypothetical protein MHB54_26565 [Paenibacillus sp. FSL M7-0802]|uniref:hypothetical protein n=1 Tax=Paenibacillus TaxID=44249 RepID=UPI0012D94628|nr:MULTISPECIES: hypothetical protein [Paenibacillus]
MASTAVVAGNPFILSEWNEYGVNPFHSTAFISMAAYACLNDWDGLIVYCYHTSESWNDQPADEITNIFDAYNDPSLICQFGFMAALFLGDLVRPAEHRVDLVFTQNDLKTLPPAFSMPNAYLPYITSLRNVFLDQGDAYTGDADVAVTAGFVKNGDLSQAKRAVYYAWSPYRDALRHANGEGRLERLAAKADEELPGAKLGDRILVFNEIAPLAGEGDYTTFAANLDVALKRWGLLPADKAKHLAVKLYTAIADNRVFHTNFDYIYKSLVEAHPFVFLDVFIGDHNELDYYIEQIFSGQLMVSPLRSIPNETFIEWCNIKGKAHYPLIASVIEPYMHVADQLQWTPVAIFLINHYSDPSVILEEFMHVFHPNQWEGSLADKMVKRLPLLESLMIHENPVVSQWAKNKEPILKKEIIRVREWEQSREQNQNERFE